MSDDRWDPENQPELPLQPRPKPERPRLRTERVTAEEMQAFTEELAKKWGLKAKRGRR